MVKSHLKRLASPRTWPIPKKSLTFISRPNPGPHKIDHQIPIVVFLRDIVGIAKTTKEVKFILHNKDCLVDGRYCYDEKRPVGLLDVVSLPKLNKYFRVMINTKNKLCAISISEKEAKTKISRISGKTSLKKGISQVNTSDSRNFRVDNAKDYAVGDSLLVTLPEQSISQHFVLKEGNVILLNAGSHVGVTGIVEKIDKDVITVKSDDITFKTKKAYAIVIGDQKPVITV